MEKKLPARAASSKQFIFWQIVAFCFCFAGASMMLGGNGIGGILFLGGFCMSVREMSLRMKWKARQNAS